MPRGGSRKGKAGQAYGNRTDLSNAVNQDRTIPTRTPAAAGPAPLAPSPSPAPLEGELDRAGVTGLFAPDQRPEVPLTAGLASGPGPGPEALMFNAGLQDDPAVADLRAIYMQFPYEGVRRLLDAYGG